MIISSFLLAVVLATISTQDANARLDDAMSMIAEERGSPVVAFSPIAGINSPRSDDPQEVLSSVTGKVSKKDPSFGGKVGKTNDGKKHVYWSDGTPSSKPNLNRDPTGGSPSSPPDPSSNPGGVPSFPSSPSVPSTNPNGESPSPPTDPSSNPNGGPPTPNGGGPVDSPSMCIGDLPKYINGEPQDEEDWVQPSDPFWETSPYAGMTCLQLEQVFKPAGQENFCNFLSQQIFSGPCALEACCFCGGGRKAEQVFEPRCEDMEWNEAKDGGVEFNCEAIDDAEDIDGYCDTFGGATFASDGLTLKDACEYNCPC